MHIDNPCSIVYKYICSLYNFLQNDDWVEMNKHQKYVDVMVKSEKQESFRRALRDAGVSHSPFIDDVGEKIKRHISRLQKRDTSGDGM